MVWIVNVFVRCCTRRLRIKGICNGNDMLRWRAYFIHVWHVLCTFLVLFRIVYRERCCIWRCSSEYQLTLQRDANFRRREGHVRQPSYRLTENALSSFNEISHNGPTRAENSIKRWNGLSTSYMFKNSANIKMKIRTYVHLSEKFTGYRADIRRRRTRNKYTLRTGYLFHFKIFTNYKFIPIYQPRKFLMKIYQSKVNAQFNV